MSDETGQTDDYDIHPTSARWTHIALRVDDIDATIDWYCEHTPLVLLDRREDDEEKQEPAHAARIARSASLRTAHGLS